MSLASARCAFHRDREASAACLGCWQTYCRECVTESEGGMYCHRCWEGRHAASGETRPGWRSIAGRSALSVFGLALLFGLFSLFLTWAATLPAHYLISGWHGR